MALSLMTFGTVVGLHQQKSILLINLCGKSKPNNYTSMSGQSQLTSYDQRLGISE